MSMKDSIADVAEKSRQQLESRPDFGEAFKKYSEPQRTDSGIQLSTDDTFDVPIDQVMPDPHQPRKVFNEEKLQELADSIKDLGIEQPIIVVKTDVPSQYQIVTGERRWRAAKLADRETVPCIVKNEKTDAATTLRRQLIENIQRADLEPVEAARSIRVYMTEAGITSNSELAKKLSKPRTWVVELLGILKIPDDLLTRVEEQSATGKPVGKSTLIDISKADPAEYPLLVDKAITSDSPLKSVRKNRASAKTNTGRAYFRRVIQSGKKKITLEMRNLAPDEGSDELVAKVLSQAARDLRKQIKERDSK